jgi:multimeric flavodoxin WrbA
MGSPRPKGNSTAIAERFLQSAKKLGASVVTHHLSAMSYRGCVACGECKAGKDRCVIRDDASKALNDMTEADVLLLASPVYFGDVSGQMKCFIDRTYSFLVPDFLKSAKPSRLTRGKKLVFVLAQGFPDENSFADIFPRYSRFFKFFGFTEIELLRACGVSSPGEVADRTELMLQTEQLAERMCRTDVEQGQE